MKRIPAAVMADSRRLFWDVDLGSLDPELHEDFILGRVLSEGSWEAIRAVKAELGDERLRAFVLRAPHRLDARSRRFFEVVLRVSEAAFTQTPFRRAAADDPNPLPSGRAKPLDLGRVALWPPRGAS